MFKVSEAFDRISQRQDRKVRSKDLVEMHYNLVKAKLYFDVNLDIEGMDKLVHPYKGYFANLEHKLYTLDDIENIYKTLLVAKHERNLG